MAFQRQRHFENSTEQHLTSQAPMRVQACLDAHAQVVTWCSWSDFVANSLLAFFMVRRPQPLCCSSQPHPSYNLCSSPDTASTSPRLLWANHMCWACPHLAPRKVPDQACGCHLAQAPVVGRWSDAYGRKAFMLLSLVCSAAQIVAMLLYIRLGTSLFWVFPAMVGGL